MVIEQTKSPIHWNYFLAFEEYLSKVARFVEFSPENFSTYSIEIAHILLAGASEVDVIAKLLCKKIAPDSQAGKIDEYRNEIRPHYPHIENMPVLIRRYGLSFKPWLNWQEGRSPNWWKQYNNIKHERNNYFPEANLQNALNALGGLFILLLHLYQEEAEEGLLVPNPTLLKLDEQYDNGVGIMGSDIYLQYNLPKK